MDTVMDLMVTVESKVSVGDLTAKSAVVYNVNFVTVTPVSTSRPLRLQ